MQSVRRYLRGFCRRFSSWGVFSRWTPRR